MEGRGEIPASVGTPNYIDLNDPDIIMPHDDEASVRRFVDDVKVAFVNAERCSAYRFQPDVSPPRRRAAPRRAAQRPAPAAHRAPSLQNVRNQTEHVLLLLANIAGRNHQSWADEGDLIVTVRRSPAPPVSPRAAAALPPSRHPQSVFGLTSGRWLCVGAG